MAALAPSNMPLPSFDDVLDAARRLSGRASVTPLLNAPLLDAELGGTLYVKPEPLQKTGSFKFRGAFNRISRLTAEEKKAGVIAYSSGNHAQGVAAAAREVGCPATIVMPKDAPALKIARTKAFGAEVVFYDRYKDSREKITEALQREKKCVLVKPFDDPYVIAGQGTVGNEIADQCAALGAAPDAVLVPVGGGGLIAGVAAYVKALVPHVRVIGVEPVDSDAMHRALAAGRPVPVERPGMFADGVAVRQVGSEPFAIVQNTVAGVIRVTHGQICEAMRAVFEDTRGIVEPAGALAVAALDTYVREYHRGRGAVVALLTGGNVNFDVLGEVARQVESAEPVVVAAVAAS